MNKKLITASIIAVLPLPSICEKSFVFGTAYAIFALFILAGIYGYSKNEK